MAHALLVTRRAHQLLGSRSTRAVSGATGGGVRGERRRDMAYWYQRTVAKRVSCTGVGLHTGMPAALALAPAAPDTGIVFVRRDLGVEIRARAENVVDTMLSTTLGAGAARVATV